jgi:hypothetical protein
LNVNSTRSQSLDNESQLADTDTEIAANLVSLCRALGGGRENSNAEGRHDIAYAFCEDGFGHNEWFTWMNEET